MSSEKQKVAAAMKIQKFWRNAKVKRDRLMEQRIDQSFWSKIVENSTSQSEQLLKKLRKLQISKSYDIQKFETILRLPPRDVNAYLQRESQKQRDISDSDDDEERQQPRHVAERRDRAARILQNYFRKIHQKTAKRRYLQRIQRVRPDRRVQHLEKLQNRLDKIATGTMIRQVDAILVQMMLEDHQAKQQTYDSDKMAKMQLDLKRACRHNTDMPNLSRPNSPRFHSTFAEMRAKIQHETRIKKIDMEIIKSQLDG